jgi:hypothetical protein
MNISSVKPNKIHIIFIFVLLLLLPLRLSSQSAQTFQKYDFGVYAEPIISWFSTDTWATKNSGARAGFCFGLSFHKYFTANYAFSTGINISSVGGRLYNRDYITMYFNNFNQVIGPDEKVTYKIQYLGIPIGLKFRSNQIGYITITSDIGIDPMVAIGGKIDIADPAISGESAKKELKDFNLGYHIMPGIEYSLGGNTSLLFGIGFEKSLLDITKDISPDQPVDKVTNNLIKIRFGVNF